MLAEIGLLSLDASLKFFSKLAAVHEDQTFHFLEFDVMLNVFVPILQLLEKVTNRFNCYILSLELFELESLHESVHIVAQLERFRLFLQVLDVFGEAGLNILLGGLVCVTALSNHLETGSSVRDKTIDVLL